MEKPNIDKLTNIPTYDLGEIYLRAVVYEDYKDMYDYGSDDLVTKTLFWDSYKTVEEAKNAVKEVFLSRPSKGVPSAYAVVHKETNKMLGTCDIFFVDWEREIAEIGYCLNRNYWGRGYMTKACKAVLDFGFNYLGLNKIVIRHHLGNIGSKRVIEKSGFIYKEDVYLEKLDTYFPTYALSKEEYKNKNI